jgi:hypothetical protein
MEIRKKRAKVLDEVCEAQGVQWLLGQVRHDIGVMAESFVSVVSIVTPMMLVGLRTVVGGRGVFRARQR